MTHWRISKRFAWYNVIWICAYINVFSLAEFSYDDAFESSITKFLTKFHPRAVSSRNTSKIEISFVIIRLSSTEFEKKRKISNCLTFELLRRTFVELLVVPFFLKKIYKCFTFVKKAYHMNTVSHRKKNRTVKGKWSKNEISSRRVDLQGIDPSLHYIYAVEGLSP